MLLEYCPGGDLGELLQKHKRIPEELVKFYMCEIILALEDLHKRDIIFRDLKPGIAVNYIVRKHRNGQRRACIADGLWLVEGRYTGSWGGCSIVLWECCLLGARNAKKMRAWESC
jgi:hypothetical protein